MTIRPEVILVQLMAFHERAFQTVLHTEMILEVLAGTKNQDSQHS